MKDETIHCACNSSEHQLRIITFEDEDEVYFDIHLNKLPFLKRLVYAFKYVFGYQCKFGAFDEFIIKPEDASKIQKAFKKK